MSAKTRTDIVADFMARVNATEACWLWTGARLTNGYGVCRRRLAHRVSHELFKGPIPSGLMIDHLCRVRNCVNPAHLEAVTNAVNQSRGARATKTHCSNGHEFTPENIYRPNENPTGRVCRACHRENAARRYARLSVELNARKRELRAARA